GSGLAALCWFLTGVVPRSYWPLLLATFGANTFMVIASTVMGGLMVEAGQKYGISGRITWLRRALQSIVSVGNGVVGGYLLATPACSGVSAPVMDGRGGFVVICSLLVLMDLAARATLRGCERLGFSIMMSAWNFAMRGSDVIGSGLHDSRGWAFDDLVWLNA